MKKCSGNGGKQSSNSQAAHWQVQPPAKDTSAIFLDKSPAQAQSYPLWHWLKKIQKDKKFFQEYPMRRLYYAKNTEKKKRGFNILNGANQKLRSWFKKSLTGVQQLLTITLCVCSELTDMVTCFNELGWQFLLLPSQLPLLSPRPNKHTCATPLFLHTHGHTDGLYISSSRPLWIKATANGGNNKFWKLRMKSEERLAMSFRLREYHRQITTAALRLM